MREALGAIEGALNASGGVGRLYDIVFWRSCIRLSSPTAPVGSNYTIVRHGRGRVSQLFVE
jgi:hypothetical protein